MNNDDVNLHGIKKPLMPCPGYFPFFIADFFSQVLDLHILAGTTEPKTKRVCTLFKSPGSIYFLNKQLSRKELHKDAAESWKVWLTYATAFSKTKRS